MFLQDLRQNPINIGDGCTVEVEIKTQGDGKVMSNFSSPVSALIYLLGEEDCDRSKQWVFMSLLLQTIIYYDLYQGVLLVVTLQWNTTTWTQLLLEQR